jgi:hypothetical protein
MQYVMMSQITTSLIADDGMTVPDRQAVKTRKSASDYNHFFEFSSFASSFILIKKRE